MGKIFTFLIYFFIYTIVFVIFKSADEQPNLTRKKIDILIGILILSLFAAIRSLEVGTDTATTVADYFEKSYSYSTVGAIISNNVAPSTAIFLIISKIIVFFGLGYRTFLFCIEFLTVLPIACVAYINRERTDMSLTMIVFMCLYFQLGFNWIRQTLAVAILLLGITLLLEKKIVRAALCAVLACLFHTSVLIGIVLYAGAWLATQTDNRHIRNIMVIAIVLVSIVLMNYWSEIATWLINKGILPTSYNGYINVFTGAHGQSYKKWFVIGKKTYIEYGLRIVMFLLPILIANIYGIPDDLQFEKRFSFFKMLSLLSVMIYGAGLIVLHSSYADRIAYLLDIANVVYLGMVCPKQYDRQPFCITLSEAMISMAVITYNLWLYYIMGWHATVPYYTSLFS